MRNFVHNHKITIDCSISNNFYERKGFGIQYEYNCYFVSLPNDKVCPKGIDFCGPRRLLSTENEKSCTQANSQFIINFY